MKVATVLMDGGRRVARVDEEAGLVFPFDIPQSESRLGIDRKSVV